ncbi:MAG: [LysW]-lysine hydrolase [Chloroflexota bacterium]
MDAVEFLREIVSIESLSGQELMVATHIVSRMEMWGYARAYVDPAGNAVGMREQKNEAGEIDEEIVLLGHIDTVPGNIPVHIKDERLYGRGSVDAKGPFAAFVLAGIQAELPPGRRIWVVGATEEEAATSKGARYVKDHFDRPDFCIIGEPSGWDGVTLGYKGRILFNYRLDQDMGHTAGPEIGVAEQAVDFWNVLNHYALEFNGKREKLFDQILPSIRTFHTSSDGITNTADMKLGFRLPPDYDIQVLIDLAEAHKGSAVISHHGHEAAYHSKRTNPLAKAFSKGILLNGGKPKPKRKTGTSDMNVVGPHWNCPIIAYGAGDSKLDHTPNEHVIVDEFLKAIAVLKTVLSNKI